ncbi:MAG: bifunctional demethylmenaquinone methyltransferase/2-methoxy-6-polyprenyl-1,4-benzoquinol methylase UbiE [candidate division NC10 bacterium]|nr:bifunctional demethylmenaquinone methyltransferase/2-methoxy-6-polyprenyl-1,4-benzoquinol methylase UbiE [candidate division NC10 bacterium]
MGDPVPGEEVRRMFAAIAPRYDFLNRLLSLGRDRGWRRTAVASANLPLKGRALDVCCGTANVALELADRFPDARIAGVDFCQEMLVLGQEKVRKAGLEGRIQLLAASAEVLPFDGKTFDAALIAFGIRNVENRERGLLELHRVLKAGGRVILLEFSLPQGKAFGKLYRLYFQRILPRIGRLFSGHPTAYSYLPASVLEFPSPEGLTWLLKKAGFQEVSFRPLTGGIVYIHVGMK